MLADQHLALGDSGALCAVRGRGVGELHIAAHVVRWQRSHAGFAAHGERAAIARDDGPELAVRDVGVAVVAPGRDGVADAEPFTRRGQHLLVGLTGGLADPVREGVDPAHLFTGVGDGELAGAGFSGNAPGPFDVAPVDDDLAAGEEFVEHLAGRGARPHPHRQLGIAGVLEAAYAVELLHPIGCVPDRQIQDPATADSRELMAVADQHHDCLGLIG